MKRIFRALIIVAVSFAAAGAAFAEDAMVRHRVQPGDTVPRLSWQYKIRADAIRAANGLTGDALTPGTTILIPAGGDVPPPAARRENEVPAAVARPAQAKPALRATTSAQDLRPVAPTKRAAPRDEAEAMPTPYVQDLGARSPQGELRPRNVPPPPPKAAGNVPRDEPPLDEINAAAAAPRKRVTAPAAVTAPRSDGAVMSDRRNPDFLRLSRQLADKGIPYNGG